MPVYEYECTNPECLYEFELVQPIRKSEVSGEPCPKCAWRGKPVLSPSSFVLKGHRWAKDGYG